MSFALPKPGREALVAVTPVHSRLREVVERCHDEGLRPRMALLLDAASEAIYLLQDLQLIPLDEPEPGASQSLAAWEELAPVMGQTVASVNRLLQVTQQAFPAAAVSDDLDGLDDAFGPTDGELPPFVSPEPEGAEEEIVSIAHAVATGLRGDLARLGERLRNPNVVADRWNLVSDLLEFRGRLRAGIGELIYQVALTTTEAERAEIVPGYAEDLLSALLLRHAATNLAFLFRGHAKRVATTSEERLPAALQDATRDVAAFSRTRALPALRTPDKRIFLETRSRLVKLATSASTHPELRAARETVENLARFFDSLSVISRRENLRVHDRAQLAAVGRHLEAAQSAGGDAETAREHLVGAAAASMALYGRDIQLDAYLRGQRHFPVDWLSDDEVPAEVDRLAGLLMNIAQP